MLRPPPELGSKPVVAAPVPDKPVEPDRPKGETSPATTPTTPATPPAAPKMARILVRSKPTDADIYRGAEYLGRTMASVNVPFGQDKVDLTLKKRGYKDYPLPVVPNQDRSFQADLVADKKGSSSSAKPSVSTAKPTGTTTKPVAESKPEGKPETKPTGKLRDLKDPFAN